jgi:hypothetical protein
MLKNMFSLFCYYHIFHLLYIFIGILNNYTEVIDWTGTWARDLWFWVPALLPSELSVPFSFYLQTNSFCRIAASLFLFTEVNYPWILKVFFFFSWKTENGKICCDLSWFFFSGTEPHWLKNTLVNINYANLKSVCPINGQFSSRGVVCVWPRPEFHRGVQLFDSILFAPKKTFSFKKADYVLLDKVADHLGSAHWQGNQNSGRGLEDRNHPRDRWRRAVIG